VHFFAERFKSFVSLFCSVHDHYWLVWAVRAIFVSMDIYITFIETRHITANFMWLLIKMEIRYLKNALDWRLGEGIIRVFKYECESCGCVGMCREGVMGFIRAR